MFFINLEKDRQKFNYDFSGKCFKSKTEKNGNDIMILPFHWNQSDSKFFFWYNEKVDFNSFYFIFSVQNDLDNGFLKPRPKTSHVQCNTGRITAHV